MTLNTLIEIALLIVSMIMVVQFTKLTNVFIEQAKTQIKLNKAMMNKVKGKKREER